MKLKVTMYAESVYSFVHEISRSDADAVIEFAEKLNDERTALGCLVKVEDWEKEKIMVDPFDDET